MRRPFSAEFKAKVAREALQDEKTLSQIASEQGLHPNLVLRWRNQAVHHDPTLRMQRGPADGLAELREGPFVLNQAHHCVTKEGQRIKLTRTESRILHYLMRHAGTLVPMRTLLEKVWGYTYISRTDGFTVRTSIWRLRHKLGDEVNTAHHLHTVIGQGFLLQAEATSEPLIDDVKQV